MLNFFLFLAKGIMLTEARRGGRFSGEGACCFYAYFVRITILSELFGKGGFKKWIGFRNGWALEMDKILWKGIGL